MDNVIGNVPEMNIVPGMIEDVIIEEVPAKKPSRAGKKMGSHKVVMPDGSISYGVKKDGSPRQAPGRKKGSKINKIVKSEIEEDGEFVSHNDTDE